MLVAPDLANRFIHEYKRFLLTIYQPEAAGDEPKRVIEKLHSARQRFIANRGLLDEYLKTLEDGVEPIDRKIMRDQKRRVRTMGVPARLENAFDIFERR